MKVAGLLVLTLCAAGVRGAEIPLSMVSSHTDAPQAQALPVGGDTGLTGVLQVVTFNDQIVRIFQQRCQSCHQDGGIGPYPLVTYADAWAHRWQIFDKTTSHQMPPWKVASACVEFANNPSLTARELSTIERWVFAGAPEGRPQDLPPPVQLDTTWPLGTPDAVLSMSEPFTPQFDKGDVYRCFVIPTGLSSQRYLSAVEVAPGNRSMVHHVLLFADTGNAAATLDAAEPGPGYTCFGGPGFGNPVPLAGWAPGNRPQLLPDGIGIDLPKGSTLVMQVHYSKRSGVVAPDVTKVGLHFSKAPVQKRLLTLPLVNQSFRIPAGAADYKVTASFPFVPFGVHVLGITPHMHLLGKSMQVEATLPGGASVCLVDVPDWDFRWQGTYAYRTAMALPSGAGLELAAYYDNSENNPNNASIPPRDVGWGENTSDEMCIAFLSFTLDFENLTGAATMPRTTLETFEPFWEKAWRTPEPRPEQP